MGVLREATVVDITPREGPLPGLTRDPRRVQVAELRLSSGDRQTHIALVLPPFSALAEEAQSVAQKLRTQLSDYVVATVVSNAPGKSELTADLRIDADVSFLLAAAAATVQYTWAWDESPAIAVTVNDTTWEGSSPWNNRSHAARKRRLAPQNGVMSHGRREDGAA